MTSLAGTPANTTAFAQSLAVVAVDLDETLVRSDKSVSPYTLETLRSWRASGKEVIIATGRPPRQTRAIPDELHAYPWICYNGSIVYQDGQEIFRASIAAEMARQIVELYCGETGRCWIGLEINDRFFINKQVSNPDAVYTQDLLSVCDTPVEKIYMALDDYTALAAEMPALPDAVRVICSTKYNVAQLMPAHVSKATGIAHLAQFWGYSLDHVIAFGDDTNDIEMIRDSRIGVAMDNAIPELKELADRITLSNDEDGVAVVLQEFL
jgi:5-amino-6-(5-phospho-D-ribitylamino)uracil phosphatase